MMTTRSRTKQPAAPVRTAVDGDRCEIQPRSEGSPLIDLALAVLPTRNEMVRAFRRAAVEWARSAAAILLLGGCTLPEEETASARVDEARAVEHLGGSTDAAASVAIVMIPHGWRSVAAFRARARAMVDQTFSQDWFEDRRGDLSFWLSWDTAANDSGFTCKSKLTDRTLAAMEHLWEPARAVSYDFGGGLQRQPDKVVALLAYDCYAFSTIGGDSAVGTAAGRSALAHELAHAIGRVHDEYSFSANPNGGQTGARSCTPSPNLGTLGRVQWSCLVESGATCPWGERVGTYTGSLGCPGMARPCNSCQMRYVSDGLDFCPICRAALDAGLARILGRSTTEICNGADDDSDGSSDEGCACAPGRDTPVLEPPCSARFGRPECEADLACGWVEKANLCLPADTSHAIGESRCLDHVERQVCDELGATDGCAWYDCADACLPIGSPTADVCAGAWGCWTSGGLDVCDARGDGLCAWYACANACLPVGSEDVPGCE